MTNEEILIKALGKAWDNGFRWYGDTKEKLIDFLMNDYEKPGLTEMLCTGDFAKAFWKDAKPVTVSATFYNGNRVEMQIEGWKYYLSQLVLEDDYYEYLARFLV